MRSLRLGIVALWLSLLSSVALGQDPPAEGALHQEEVAAPEDADDDMALQLTAGATFNYGNARNFAVNLGGQYRLRRGQHALVIELGWIYGLASTRIDPDMMMYQFGDFTENTNNFTGRLRYDFYITPDDALFVALRGRNDPFANLEPRLGGQIGYLRNLFREEKHRAWIELGVDGTYDNFGEPLAIGGGTISEDRFVFSWRAFFGYSNELTDLLTYNTGLEVLGEIARAPGVIEPGHLRFEWVNQLRSKIEDWLQISLDVTMRFDSQPAGQQQPWQEEPIATRATEMFDLVTTLNLVGNFDLDGTPEEEEAAEEEPAPACPACPVCETAQPCPEPAVEEPPADDTPDEGVEAPVEDTPEEEEPALPDTTSDEPEAL